MSKRRAAETKPGAELTTIYNNRITLDGRQKEYCGGCGLPRDPEYAKTHQCGACGELGTQQKPPQFDENGDRIEPAPKPAAVVAAPVEPKLKPPTLKQQQVAARMATASLFRAALKGA